MAKFSVISLASASSRKSIRLVSSRFPLIVLTSFIVFSGSLTIYTDALTFLTEANITQSVSSPSSSSSSLFSPSSSSSASDPAAKLSHSLHSRDTAGRQAKPETFPANDEEAGVENSDGSSSNNGNNGNHTATPMHVLDRQPWGMYPNHQPDGDQTGSAGSNLSAISTQQWPSPSTGSGGSGGGRNCSYTSGEVFCDCDLHTRRLSCYNIESVEDIRRAYDHLLNTTRLVYWASLEIHCVEPAAGDDPSSSASSTSSASTATDKDKPNTAPKSYHISQEMFAQGPRFESVLFVGDCSKPKHYDNLNTVDREVQRIVMINNMLRMATSCSLLQPKFERLTELTLRDSLVAGDMISSTFSTRCLGQYGTRNEPMQLTRLVITRCNISLVESGAFYNFAELEVIDLSGNQISHLSRASFAPHLYRLRQLKLDHNRLASLGDEFFEKLPELREVNLANNRLTTLPVLSPAGPGVAQVVHMARNAWDCRCRLTWLLDEPLDSARLLADEPVCMTPATVKNVSLFKGLQTVLETFC